MRESSSPATSRREFLRNTGRTAAASALVAGLITWGIAAYVLDIDGASREATEGFAALLAAAILVGVGIWMHGKSLAGRWQSYLKDQISSALSKRSAWFLFGLAFVAVYREVFETILFYIALWARGNVGAIIGGFFAGVAVLVVITIVMLRTSRRPCPRSSSVGASSWWRAVAMSFFTSQCSQ